MKKFSIDATTALQGETLDDQTFNDLLKKYQLEELADAEKEWLKEYLGKPIAKRQAFVDGYPSYNRKFPTLSTLIQKSAYGQLADIGINVAKEGLADNNKDEAETIIPAAEKDMNGNSHRNDGDLHLRQHEIPQEMPSFQRAPSPLQNQHIQNTPPPAPTQETPVINHYNQSLISADGLGSIGKAIGNGVTKLFTKSSPQTAQAPNTNQPQSATNSTSPVSVITRETPFKSRLSTFANAKEKFDEVLPAIRERTKATWPFIGVPDENLALDAIMQGETLAKKGIDKSNANKTQKKQLEHADIAKQFQLESDLQAIDINQASANVEGLLANCKAAFGEALYKELKGLDHDKAKKRLGKASKDQELSADECQTIIARTEALRQGLDEYFTKSEKYIKTLTHAGLTDEAHEISEKLKQHFDTYIKEGLLDKIPTKLMEKHIEALQKQIEALVKAIGKLFGLNNTEDTPSLS